MYSNFCSIKFQTLEDMTWFDSNPFCNKCHNQLRAFMLWTGLHCYGVFVNVLYCCEHCDSNRGYEFKLLSWDSRPVEVRLKPNSINNSHHQKLHTELLTAMASYSLDSKMYQTAIVLHVHMYNCLVGSWWTFDLQPTSSLLAAQSLEWYDLWTKPQFPVSLVKQVCKLVSI